MYWNDHNPPHFHVKYSEYSATMLIDGGILAGCLPNRALSLVIEWLYIHKSEMLDNWFRAQNGLEIKPIDPLE